MEFGVILCIIVAIIVVIGGYLLYKEHKIEEAKIKKITRKRWNWESQEGQKYCPVHGLLNEELILDIEYDTKTGEAIKVVHNECARCPGFGSW